MIGEVLPRAFYDRPTLEVAQDLLGKYVVHLHAGVPRAGKIVEVEAYIGEEDRACHCRFGRTARTAPMYGPPGHAYLYLIYGTSTMLNVVTEGVDRPAAVLIRALEPAEHVLGRTDGPGRLTAALAIPRSLNGHDLLQPPLLLVDRGDRPARVVATERVNIDYAGEWRAMPWRFLDPDSRFLSVRPRKI